MGKIAGIRGKSPEAYPPDNTGKRPIQTESVTYLNNGHSSTLIGFLAPQTLFAETDPIEVDAADGDRIIVLCSGVFANPRVGGENPGNVTVQVQVFLNDVPVFAIQVRVTVSGNSPIPFSIFFGQPIVAEDTYSIDVRAQVVSVDGADVTNVSNSLVVIVSPV